MKTTALLIGILSITISAYADLTRMETSTVTKITYFGKVTDCAQEVRQSGSYRFFNALVPIPEFTNAVSPPAICVLAEFKEGWGVFPSQFDWRDPGSSAPLEAVVITNGIMHLTWKIDGGGSSTYFTNFAVCLIVDSAQPQLGQAKLRIQKGASEAILSFVTEQGVTYALEYADRITTATDWLELTNGIVGSGETKKVMDYTVESERYYRLRGDLQSNAEKGVTAQEQPWVVSFSSQ